MRITIVVINCLNLKQIKLGSQLNGARQPADKSLLMIYLNSDDINISDRLMPPDPVSKRDSALRMGRRRQTDGL